jgi:hypothetical protein
MPPERAEDLREGDRVEYIGPDYGPDSGFPRPGERGTIIHLSPHDDVVAWDEAGSEAGALVRYLKRVEEADPTE